MGVAAAAAETLAEEIRAGTQAETLAVAMRADLAAARPARVRGCGRRGGNGGESVGGGG